MVMRRTSLTKNRINVGLEIQLITQYLNICHQETSSSSLVRLYETETQSFMVNGV